MSRNRILYILIALSALPLLFAIPTYGLVYEGDLKSVLRIAGIICGELGILILTWQFLLGFRFYARFITPDLIFVNNLHQLLGKYGSLLIFIHPGLLLAQYGFNYLFSPESLSNVLLTVGKMAMGILFIIWITSALIRGKIRFRPWKYIHYFAYLALPLALYHSINIGTVLNLSGLVNYWYFVVGLLIFMLIMRVLHQAGLFRHHYRVVELKPEAAGVMSIYMEPVKRSIFPVIGQFIYIQPRVFGENHPFTVSDYDPTTQRLSITVKDLGPFTHRIHSLQPGQIVFLDGPYGVFTAPSPVSSPKVIFIAGGIGITPFRQFFTRNINLNKFSEVYLFYGCKTIDDVAFKSELEKAQKLHPNVKVLFVMSNMADKEMPPMCESGFVTIDLLRKHVKGELTNYVYYVCGPVPMMKGLAKSLKELGIVEGNIRSEKFSL